MRSFRTAAVAGLSAVALTLASTSVAAAQDEPNDTRVNSSDFATLSSGSSALGEAWNADEDATGEDIFGEEHKRNTGELPTWADKMYDLTVAGTIASILGMIVFPAYNWAVYNGYIR